MRKFIQPEQNTSLHPFALFGYPFGVVAKSATSRRKLLNLEKANSTPILNRAFFVRSVRTPKENALGVLLSMVGRKGQRLGVGCSSFSSSIPTPLRFTASRRKLAESLSNLEKETATMLFKFLVLGEKRLTISIRAKSEAEARQKLQFTSPALCVARLKGGVYA